MKRASGPTISRDFLSFPVKQAGVLECKVEQMSGEARSLIGKWKGQTDGSPDGSEVYRCRGQRTGSKDETQGVRK